VLRDDLSSVIALITFSCVAWWYECAVVLGLFMVHWIIRRDVSSTLVASTSTSNTVKVQKTSTDEGNFFVMQPKCLKYNNHSSQSFAPYVTITVSCSLSMSHQCHTRQTPLHLRNMSAETRASDIFDLNGLIISPPLLKTCSIGELDAGTLRARSAGWYNLSSCCRCCRQNEKQSNDGSYSQSINVCASVMRHCSVV